MHYVSVHLCHRFLRRALLVVIGSLYYVFGGGQCFSFLKFSRIWGGVRAVACIDTGSNVYVKVKSSVFFSVPTTLQLFVRSY